MRMGTEGLKTKDLKYRLPEEAADGPGVEDLDRRSASDKASSWFGGDLGGELLASSNISAPSGTSICIACMPELNLMDWLGSDVVGAGAASLFGILGNQRVDITNDEEQSILVNVQSQRL